MTLLNSTPEEVNELLLKMATDSKAIIKEVAEICWYMRGSITWDEAMRLSHDQKEIISAFIKENIERGDKAGIPLI